MCLLWKSLLVFVTWHDKVVCRRRQQQQEILQFVFAFFHVPHFSYSAFYPTFRSTFLQAEFRILHVRDFLHSAIRIPHFTGAPKINSPQTGRDYNAKVWKCCGLQCNNSCFRRWLCKIDFYWISNRSVIIKFVLFVICNLNLYLSLGQLLVSSLLSVLHIVILYFTPNL